VHKGMSALPPIATSIAHFADPHRRAFRIVKGGRSQSPVLSRTIYNSHGNLSDLLACLDAVAAAWPVVNRSDATVLVILNSIQASRPKPSEVISVPCVRLRSCGVAGSTPSDWQMLRIAVGN
jgi:hypothetical protein